MNAIEDLIKTVAALREPDTGCPWDIEQDHQSIAECLVDECCELLQTIDRLDLDPVSYTHLTLPTMLPV